MAREETSHSGPWRVRHHVRAASALGATLLVVASLLFTLQDSLANEYIRLGFTRTPVFMFAGALRELALPVFAALVALGTGIVLVMRRPGRRASGPAGMEPARAAARAALIVLPLLTALAVALQLGYMANRYHFSAYWRDRTPLLGLDLPTALVSPEVWRANVIVLAKALAVGIVVWLLLRIVVGPGARRGVAVWRLAGHPASLVLAAAALVAGPLAARVLRAEGSRPNIILFSIDTLRADHLSSYGYARDTSPALDALAAQGLLFENCVSPAPNTPPSHMSIFTSLYPTTHGFRGESDRLAGWRLTLTEYLREAGYRTVATTDGGFVRRWYGFGQGFERYDDRKKGIAASSERVLEWLDGGLAGTPFFLFVHNYDVHSPYDPPPPYRAMYTDPAYDGGFFPGSRELETIRRRLNRDPSVGHGLTAADVQFLIDRYDGGIRYTDAVIGDLIAALDARGLLDDTWIFVTSDHGEEFTEHGSVLHEKLYRTVTHVPLIVRPPGGSEVPRRVRRVVELTDIMPTILDVAGIAPASSQPLQGASLLAFAREGGPASWDDVAYSEHPWRGGRRAITRPDLHVLTSVEHREIEAYAYREDPLEQSDLAAGTPGPAAAARGVVRPLEPDTLRSAMRSLLRWNDAQAAIAATGRGGTESLVLDEETMKELRALGYLQ